MTDEDDKYNLSEWYIEEGSRDKIPKKLLYIFNKIDSRLTNCYTEIYSLRAQVEKLEDEKEELNEYTKNIDKDITTLDNDNRRLQCELKRRKNEWLRERMEFNERIEILESLVFDLINPPPKPVLKNPFD